ncbi:urokinase plasminogen activator surface receptor-like [Triplophysa dalaica]|uniref:urokinase plasminogen activator surface receptor-like n=1 Tax=Triplophysa dalaica TaxID=1582913 RepID=UPI0024DFC087|nr:urokinase plasminogen activator surface receptor-like [Triplophysa dalaica]
MHLNIFTVLIFTLHAEGHVLKCYNCTDLLGPCVKEEMMCSTQEALCSSQTTVQSIGNASQSTKIKSCTEPKMCVNGSVNFGITRTATTMQCCFTDLCNSRDVSDSSSNTLNGKQCYYCNKKSCVNKVNCAGSEDHCIKAKVNSESMSMTVKGCASKSMCDVPSQISQVYSDISCCEGNLCNSAKSITQNLLILLSWPFISYIMFH